MVTKLLSTNVHNRNVCPLGVVHSLVCATPLSPFFLTRLISPSDTLGLLFEGLPWVLQTQLLFVSMMSTILLA